MPTSFMRLGKETILILYFRILLFYSIFRPDLEIEDEENEAEGFDKIEQKVGGDEEHKKSKKKSDKKSIELENLE